MNRSLIFFLPLMAMLGLGGCDYPKKIQEIPEPWKILDPGVPLEKFPKIEIISQGGGPTIDAGDLVQIKIRHQMSGGPDWDDRGDWWMWIGFRTSAETAFFSYEPAAVSAVLGLRQGSVFKFIEPKEGIGSGPQYAGKLSINVFGATDYYRWRKNTTGFATLYVSHAAGTTAMEIKRVCKGQAQYRTVRLFDDSPVQICSGVNCRVSTEEREAWVDEARIDVVCQDGKKVNFQYGPIGSRNGKAGRSPKRGYFDEWFHAAWSKIPEGVQFEGNHAPEVKKSRVTTKAGVPVKIDFLANARDADGDKLTMRIDSSPQHGKLAANSEGGMIYTPEVGWFGVEQVSYRVTDGMAEKGGYVDIEVVQ